MVSHSYRQWRVAAITNGKLLLSPIMNQGFHQLQVAAANASCGYCQLGIAAIAVCELRLSLIASHGYHQLQVAGMLIATLGYR